MAKKWVAIALAAWMTWAAFAGLTASALPNHVVAGGVFGPVPPGTQPGPTNAANAAGMVFYSTNQPSFPLLSGADSYTGADGTNPALFAKDVGASWNWVAGDIVVAVVETTRGVNGWTGANYTTSIDAALATGPTVQDIGDATLEPFPAITLTAGANYVNVQWPPARDTAGNVVSYELYSAPAWNGPWSVVNRVAQGPNPAYNHTGLAPGNYCYTLAVNYRRDTGTGVYETTGRSEVVCTSVLGAAPRILVTNPANGAANVPVNQPIVVTFDQAMDTTTLQWTINPGITLLPTWSGGNTVVTFTHATDFLNCQSYQMAITQARNPAGRDLGPGPVPNPWAFSTVCIAPYTTATTPPNGATGVRAVSLFRVDFSEPILTTSATVEFSPAASAGPFTWSMGNQRLEFTPTLAPGVTYTVWVNGTDVDGNAILHPGPGAPNPWTFTTNVPPSAAITSPRSGECRSGGVSMSIAWTMDDPDAAETALYVWINYTYGASTFNVPGAQALTGLTPPYSFSWTPPTTINGNVELALEVRDASGESDQALSGPFEIDSIPPTATSVPADGATNVATNAPIVVTFSEAMATTATENAFQISPSIPVSFAWSAGDTVLTITHTTLFDANTVYTISFTPAATDACTPGLSIDPPFSASFTTGGGTKRPNPPQQVQASASSTGITVTWQAPTTYFPDNSPIPAGDLTNYRVYRSTDTTFGNARLIATKGGTELQHVDTDVTAGTTYYYWVVAVSATYGDSDPSSPPASATAQAPPGPGFDWLLILIPLIVILVLVGLFLLLRRKKPAAAPAKPTEAPPAAEAPAEQPPAAGGEAPAPAEEGGEKYIPCPNCGTMVKPTDAECFVCGAKL